MKCFTFWRVIKNFSSRYNIRKKKGLSWQLFDPKTKFQSVSDGWCHTINVSGRAYRGPICGYLVIRLQNITEPFALLW